MSLTASQVKKIATLARIKLNDIETDQYCNDLNNIFKWIDQLNEVNTDNIEPLNSITKGNSVLRTDKVTENNNQNELIKIAPHSKYNYYVVPKVME